MKMLFTIFGWLIAVIFLILSALCLWAGNWIPAIPLILAAVLLIPPLREKLSARLGISLPFWPRLVLIPVLFMLSVYLIFAGMGNKDSIYKNADIESRLMSIYDARMETFPVPYESQYIDTKYGKVHVIISGPEDGPPILLLHASAMSSWSWLYNIKELNSKYRTYAIDTIGDAGKSVLSNIEVYPADGPSLAALYEEIMDSLDVASAYFIGASQGGYISSNLALHAPERVNGLILCGPMGYTGTNASVFRILLTTMFPIPPLQNSATRWAFGDDPAINAVVSDWFGAILEGVISRQARPAPFSKDQINKIDMPVLLLLGSRDGLVGNPEDTEVLAENFPDARVHVLDTGHLISAEKPDRFNSLVMDFIENRKE